MIAFEVDSMERHTFAEAIRAFKRRKPFHPFTVKMTDGDQVKIDYPDALAIRDDFAAYIGLGNVPVFLDFENVSQIADDLAGGETNR